MEASEPLLVVQEHAVAAGGRASSRLVQADAGAGSSSEWLGKLPAVRGAAGLAATHLWHEIEATPHFDAEQQQHVGAE